MTTALSPEEVHAQLSERVSVAEYVSEVVAQGELGEFFSAEEEYQQFINNALSQSPFSPETGVAADGSTTYQRGYLAAAESVGIIAVMANRGILTSDEAHDLTGVLAVLSQEWVA